MTAKSKSQAAKEGVETTSATQLDVTVPEPPPTFDLVGEDDRRLARAWSKDACLELKHRIETSTGEKLKIVPASPFSSIQVDSGT